MQIDAYLDQQTERKQPNMATGDVMQDHDLHDHDLPQYEEVGADDADHGDGLDNVDKLLKNRSTGRLAAF